MPFPTTQVLDDLKRAALGAGWTGPTLPTHTLIVDTVNGARGSGVGAFSDGYFSAASYGPDVEVFVTVPTLPSGASDETMMLLARFNPASSGSGYGLEVDRAANWKIMRIDAGTQTQLLQDNGVTTPTIAAGDSIGVAVIGNTIYGYHKPAASNVWNQVISFSDSTYAAAGRIGLEAFSNVELLTNFGGGTVVVPLPPRAPLLMPLRRMRLGPPLPVFPPTGAPAGGGAVVNNVAASDTGTTFSEGSPPFQLAISRAVVDTGTSFGEALVRVVGRFAVDTGASVSDSAAPRTTRVLQDTGAAVSDAVASARRRALSDTGTTFGEALARRVVRVIDDRPVTVHDGGATGFQLPTTQTQVLVNANDVAWTSPANALLDDGSYATIDSLDAFSSGWSEALLLGGLGFSVPASARVVGFEVELDMGYTEDVGDAVWDPANVFVRFAQSGTLVGGPVNGVYLPRVGSTAVFRVGGTSALFGTALTGADVNSSGFQLSLQVSTDSSSGNPIAIRLDYAKVRVFYDVPVAARVGRPVADTGAALSETLARSLVVRSLADAGASVSDATARVVGRQLADTGASVSDTPVAGLIYSRFISDTGASVSASVARGVGRAVADTGAAASDVAPGRAVGRVLADTGAAVTDSAAAKTSRQLSDAGASVSEALAISRLRARTAADAGATVSESLVRVVGRVLADTGATVSDSVARNIARAVTALDTGATISSVLVPRTTRVLTDAGATVSDTPTNLRVRVISDAGATVSDALARSIPRSVADTGASVSDSARVGTGRQLADTGASVSDSPTANWHLNRYAADTGSSVSDSLQGGRTFFRTPTDTGAVVTDALARSKVGRALTDTGAVISEALARGVGRSVSDAGAALSDGIAAGRAFSRSPADQGASVSDSAARLLLAVRARQDIGVSSNMFGDLTESIRRAITRVVVDGDPRLPSASLEDGLGDSYWEAVNGQNVSVPGISQGTVVVDAFDGSHSFEAAGTTTAATAPLWLFRVPKGSQYALIPLPVLPANPMRQTARVSLAFKVASGGANVSQIGVGLQCYDAAGASLGLASAQFLTGGVLTDGAWHTISGSTVTVLAGTVYVGLRLNVSMVSSSGVSATIRVDQAKLWLDDPRPVAGVGRALADTGASVADAAGRSAVGRALADTGASVSSSAAVAVGRRVVDTGASVSDAVASGRGATRGLTDTGASVSDVARPLVRRGLADAGASISDIVLRGHGASISLGDVGASVAESAASARVVQRALGDALVIADALSALAVDRRDLADVGASVGEQVAREIRRGLVDVGASVSDAAQVARAFARVLADGFAVADGGIAGFVAPLIEGPTGLALAPSLNALALEASATALAIAAETRTRLELEESATSLVVL